MVRLIALTFFLTACGAGQHGAAPARLRLIAQPAAARVHVDDHFRGSATVVARRPLELPAGVHFVTISAPGHFPHDLELDLPAGETTVRVSLRPIPR